MFDNNSTTAPTPRACLKLVQQQISGDRAFETVELVSRFHRIQASAGLRAAANICADRLRTSGTDASVRSYPANLSTRFFTQKSFQEWDCREAWLELTAPWQERLCDFERDDMSIIQRSGAADWRDEPLPIVYLPQDCAPATCQSDLNGKILFVENGYDRWISKALQLGALGIITVSMPEIAPVRVNMSEDPDLCDRCANLSFHHLSEGDGRKLFGFTLTPLQGKRLREACIELAKEGKFPTAKAYVNAHFHDGSLENVEAQIPGTGDEEILLVAHLCHPKSSVNDNASGVGCAVEAFHALQYLIDNGQLPRPKRTIRLILVPEFTGVYAYLSAHEDRLERIKAGLNMDMVAGRQDGKAGAFLIIDTPDCSHSFVGDLSRILLDEQRKECALAARGQYTSLFHSEVKSFMLGSDHYILSDPTIAIPAVAFTQWPDKTYHTSADSLEHIDKGLLFRVSALAASYVYSLADLTVESAEEILLETRKRFFTRFTQLALRAGQGEDVKELAVFCKEHALATCDSYPAFFSGEERTLIQTRVDQEKQYLSAVFELTFGSCGALPASKGKVPLRLFKAPLSMRSLLSDLSPAQQELFQVLPAQHPEGRGLDDYIIYAMDGKRTLEDIARCVQLETGASCLPYIVGLTDLLCQLDLVKYVTKESEDGK